MKTTPSITHYIPSNIKSKLTPSLQGFSAVLLMSQASVALGETLNEDYQISTGGNSIAQEITELPTDGKLTGSLTINNGTETDYTTFGQIEAIKIVNVPDTLTLEDFKLSITSYGVNNASAYMDIYAVNGGVISLKNTSITINSHGGKGMTYVHGISNSTVMDFDSTSTITLTNKVDGATQVYGIKGTVQSFAGSVTVDSTSRAEGVILSDTADYSTRFAATTSVKAIATTKATALNYTLTRAVSDGALADFDGTFTATSSASGNNGSATAAQITAYHTTSVNSISGTYSATADLRAQALVLDGNIYTKTIDADLTIKTTGSGYTSDAVGYAGLVGVIDNTSETGVVRESGFDHFTGDITATGASNAVGMELWNTNDSSNISGTISGNISASTNDTHFLTRGEYGLDGNLPGFDRSTFHFKSTAAIRIIRAGAMELVSAESSQKSELNFAHGAKAEAWVGAEGSPKSYGDAIQFTVDHLVLNAAPSATVTLIGDITTDSEGYGGYSGGGGGDVRSLDVGVGSQPSDSTTRRILTYNEGTYNVSSDYWFVTQVELGNSETSATSHVRLKDSTRFVDTDTVNFHVNSAADYSNITVSAAEVLTVTEMGNVNVTLGAELMHTENFEIHLIAGNIIDTQGKELFIKLTDLVAGDGVAEGSLGDDLSSIYIVYNGKKVFYTEGMSIVMDGSSTNLTIGRGVIPEPSTATLSLLALAGFIARRRRRAI